MAEAGVNDMIINIWTGVVAPAGTPAPIVKRLADEIARSVRAPDVRERLLGMGVDPVSTTPEEFRAIIAADITRWSAVAKSANIKSD